MKAAAAVGAVAVAALLAGCTSAVPPAAPSPPAPVTVVTGTRTITATRPAPTDSYHPPSATSVAPLPPGRRAPAGQRDGHCPYIRAGLDQDPTSRPNVADIEGDRVYRTTLLTRLHPLGCRFWFSYAPHEAIADILPTTFASARAAHDALVRTAEAGSDVEGRPGVAAGVDGIRYRTRFFGPDGARDWAFAFAKGRVLVVVHTQQDDVELNAELLARAVVGSF